MTGRAPRLAPGHPGIEPRWTSSAKSGVGTARTAHSRVWFTLSHGILNEVYFPTIDRAAIRDLGLLVGGPDGFLSEEKRDTDHRVEPIAPGVPGYRLTNTCRDGRYRIVKTVVADPRRDAVVQEIRFEALAGTLDDHTLYVLLAPHLGNRGYGNTAWVGDDKGHPMLFAEGAGLALALASSAPFSARSCGYVGVSDGWQDLMRHRRLTWHYDRAEDGNVALTGAVDLAACEGRLVLALGFGDGAAQAALNARAALQEDYADLAGRYREEWEAWHRDALELSSPSRDAFDLYRTSLTVLATHESKRCLGATIASLSIPWGASHGDGDLGGYHLVWPRDLVETAQGLLAAGETASARRTLRYLMAVQEADGHWLQNMWLSGEAYWAGTQDDETALPILLADALAREDALDGIDAWPVVRRAAAFLVRTGPTTPQERWEENGGYSVYALAVQVAALLAAADFADRAEEPGIARTLRQTADLWNDRIEAWTYARGTPLARRLGVDGYYVRIAPPGFVEGDSLAEAKIRVKNRPWDESEYPASEIVGPDALALVHFGLRAADDPRIVDTVRVIDALTRTETRNGPVWRRYTHDGYGEHADGSPFDGTGIGRGWPLLACERAAYELAAGHREEAERLVAAVARQASPGGLIPEQVWDAEDVPARELVNGEPAGSAMPLVWAHAEVLKIVRSLHDGRVFTTPPQPVERYQRQGVTSAFTAWRFGYRVPRLARGQILRLEVHAPAMVRWSADGWATVHDQPTRDTGLGLHLADLPTADLPAGTGISFTFRWPEAGRWEGQDFTITVV